MSSPYLAPSLARLRTAINTRWPGRDKASDGWIGDRAHQARTSDHNPDDSGVVRALDVDRDGVHVPTVLAAMFLNPAIRYVIHNRRIFHANSSFKPKKYAGSNGHEGHIHGSIQHLKSAENSKAGWSPIDAAFRWPQLKRGSKGVPVRQLQAYLNGHGASLAIDGDFGSATLAAVISFQRKVSIDVDGVVGTQTSQALRTK